eukprot:14454326-Ditylum_brightwellii.AAC.1
MPDILIHNYSVGSERRRDGNGISQASSPAIFEVKGIYVDKQAKQVREEYATKACKCNAKFAQDIPEEPSPLRMSSKHS